jgi:hypothetical protein
LFTRRTGSPRFAAVRRAIQASLSTKITSRPGLTAIDLPRMALSRVVELCATTRDVGARGQRHVRRSSGVTMREERAAAALAAPNDSDETGP